MQQANCDYPYLGPDCSIPYAKVLGKSYNINRFVFLGVSCLTFLFTSFQLGRVLLLGGLPHQRKIFLLLEISSLCLCLRSVDPHGYGGIYPLIIDTLFSDCITSSLYSLCFVCILFWIKLLKSNTPKMVLSKDIIVWSISLHIFTWISFFTCTIVGFYFRHSLYIEFKVSKYCLAVLFWGIIVVFGLNNGLKINRRLKAIRVMNLNTDPLVQRRQTLEMDDRESGFSEGSSSYMDQNSHSEMTRLVKMLILFSICALLVLTAQALKLIQVLITKKSDIHSWEKCLRDRCTEASLSFPIVTTAQYIGVWLGAWIFGRIKSKKHEIDRPPLEPLRVSESYIISSSSFPSSASRLSI